MRTTRTDSAENREIYRSGTEGPGMISIDCPEQKESHGKREGPFLLDRHLGRSVPWSETQTIVITN